MITNEEGQTGKCQQHVTHYFITYSQSPIPLPSQFSCLLNAKLKIKCDASQESQLTTLISNYVYRKHLITQVARISRLWNLQFRIGLAHSTAGVTSRVCHNPSGVCLRSGLYFSTTTTKNACWYHKS